MKPIRNARIRYEYEILETYIAGIVLDGWEVKSIREGHANIKPAWVSIRDDEAWLLNVHVSPYKHSSTVMPPIRERKLLLKKREIAAIEKASKEAGRTIAVLALLPKGNTIKAEIAVVRGKKVHEKRAVIKARDADREARKALKNYSR